MARDSAQGEDFRGPLRRLLTAVLILCLLAVFLVWRIDNPRVEKFRARVVDRVVPNFDWAMAPVTATVELVRDAQSYKKLYEQNQELRRELQRMKSWKEAALQLEQENARLLDLNKVRLDPRLTAVSGEVLADSGSPFRQSVLINVGEKAQIVDGWAAMDGVGLVGRISGVGRNTSRVILLTDTSSRIPATIQPSGQKALISGDNSPAPLVEFLENSDLVRPGDRVITSGDGKVFPSGLLMGQVQRDPAGRLRVRLAADYERLKFVRVLRSYPKARIRDAGELIAPARPLAARHEDEGASAAAAQEAGEAKEEEGANDG